MHRDHVFAEQWIALARFDQAYVDSDLSSFFASTHQPKRLRGVGLMRKVRKAWPIWATMHAQGRVRALPHEAARIQRRDKMRRSLKTRRENEARLDAYLTNSVSYAARATE